MIDNVMYYNMWTQQQNVCNLVYNCIRDNNTVPYCSEIQVGHHGMVF